MPTSTQNFENEETLAHAGIRGIPPASELSPVQQGMAWQQISGTSVHILLLLLKICPVQN